MNYTDPKYYHLEPYHNPAEVDESKVPRGWRMRYQSEAGARVIGACKIYDEFTEAFSLDSSWYGLLFGPTYIVPVKEA